MFSAAELVYLWLSPDSIFSLHCKFIKLAGKFNCHLFPKLKNASLTSLHVCLPRYVTHSATSES
jgi:hypothetical protein